MSRSRELSDEVKEAVRDALYACVENSDVWLEYGIIEYRFKSRYPGLYRELIDAHGHRELGDRSGTTSNYLGKRLGGLNREGAISTRIHTTHTGCWSYLSKATHAAGVPAPPEDRFLSWHDYATQEGLDPDVWFLYSDGPDSPDERPCGNPECDGVAVRRNARNGKPYWECEKDGFEDYRQSLS